MEKTLSSLDWTLVETFVAVAETGSFSAAARALRSSQPTVGRQIRQMEDALSLTLFDRHSKGLTPTSEGAALLGPAQAMREAARQIELTAAGRSGDLAGTVRITASVFTAHHLLPPIIAKLRREVPELRIELAPSDASDNLLFREADIAVRMYRSEQLDIVTQHLGDAPLGVYASRAYLDHAGHPESMEDLSKLDFVGYDRSELIIRGMRQAGWDVDRDWFSTRCDLHSVYFELVLAGCGVGFAQCNVAKRYPELIRLFPQMPLPGLPLWLAAHQSLRKSPRIALVWDRLRDGLLPFVS